jgi:hypothetical protein
MGPSDVLVGFADVDLFYGKWETRVSNLPILIALWIRHRESHFRTKARRSTSGAWRAQVALLSYEGSNSDRAWDEDREIAEARWR